jgi:hypothetical protein
MSLTSLPVTAADLLQLQLGIQQFQNPGEANTEVPLINAGTTTVLAYANQLIANNISLSQVAMAVDSLMFGKTDSVAELTKLSTQFLPPQMVNALANGFNPTVYDAEALGLALAGGNGTSNAFATNFGSLSVSAFAQAAATATGVNANAIQQFVTNWINFYTANPTATGGLSVTLASYGAAFGDAVGVALVNPTAANLQALVANALIDNAEGSYAAGTPLGAQAQHVPLQGEGLTFRLSAQEWAANPVLTVNNQTGALTVIVENNTTAANSIVVGATGAAAGIADNFTLVMGSNIQNAVDTLGTAVSFGLNLKGDEFVSIVSQGGTSAGTNLLGYAQLTPTVGGPEQVMITGDHNITIGATEVTLDSGSGGGAIADLTAANTLEINNLRIIDTDSGVTTFVGSLNGFGGSPLVFSVNDGYGSFNSYSTNAVFIDASKSGGLIMQSGDGNIAVGSLNTIIGSAIAGNVLGGSIGKDVFTSSLADVANTIYTDGGPDQITLGPNHTASNHIGL